MQDGELYELCGLGWRFPIRVKWIGEFMAEVRICDIPLLKLQRKAIEEGLADHATHREGQVWFFAPKGLESCAVKSAFTEPEEIVIWQRTLNEINPHMDFIDAYCNSRDTVIRSTKQFVILWSSISKFMLEWMLFHNRSVDLGWAQMNAFCARVNWKQGVFAKIWARRRMAGAPITEEEARRETRNLLHQSWLTAYDEKTRLLRWTVEVTPGIDFHETAAMVERTRKRAAQVSYLGDGLRFLKSPQHKDRMYEALLAYAEETKRPYAALPHGVYKSGSGSRAKPTERFHRAQEWTSPPLVAGHKMEDKTGRALVSADAQMSTVQDLQSLSQDLRNAGRDVDAAGQNCLNAVGVFMLPAIEKPTASQLLEIRSNRRDNGVAASSEQLPNQEGVMA